MSISAYRLAVRGAIRGLWNNVLDIDQFFDQMSTAIQRQIPLAYAEGAAECEILPADFTSEERIEIQRLVTTEVSHVFRLGMAVEEGNRASGTKLGKHFNRVRLWMNRYQEAQNAGKVTACADLKLKWGVHSKEPCISAKRLRGKVKRASFWKSTGIVPGNPNLECVRQAKGIPVCSCTLTPTNEAVSRGPLPRLP